jgi:hypothetical protein
MANFAWAGRELRKPGVSSRNPEAKYKVLYEIDCDEDYQFHVVERIADGALMMRKTTLVEDTRSASGDPHRELMLVRNFDHPNVVYYEDGFSRPSRQTGHGQKTAIYNPLSKYGTLRHVGFRLALDNRRPPESFVWHVLKEMAAALVYLQLGYSSLAEADSYGWNPHPNHKPVMHSNIELGNMWVGTNERWTFCEDTDEESRVNPRIRLANFHGAEQWPRWSTLLRQRHEASLVIDPGRPGNPTSLDTWADAEIYDIRRLLRSITFFCGGRAVGISVENQWGNGVELPDGYSSQLQHLLESALPGLPAHLRTVQDVADLALAITAFISELTLQPEPIPIEYLGPLHTLPALARKNGITDLLYQTFIIDDDQSVSRPGPEPLVWDGLIHEEADHFDQLGAPLPFIARVPSPEWFRELRRWTPAEVQLAIQTGKLDAHCPICYVAWFQGGMEVVTNPCQGQHVYCVECLQHWLADHGTCPQCREAMRVIHGFKVFPIRVDLYGGPANALFQPEIESASDDTEMQEPEEEEEETPPEQQQASFDPSVYSLHEQQELQNR